MSASQLLRILQTLPAVDDDEICAFNTDEPDSTTNRSSKCTNPFLSNEENKNSNFCCTPELETSIFGNDFPSHAFEKTPRFYIAKNSVEYELPELMVCYQESDFQVKDICIDEGIPDKETTVANSVPMSEDDDDMIEASLDSDFLKDEWLKPSCITDCEEKLNSSNNLKDDVSTEQQDWPSLASLEFLDSSNSYSDDSDQGTLKELEAGKVLTVNQMEASEALNSESIYDHLDAPSVVRHHDVAMTVANHEARYVGESSFSMSGVITELISCSRPITFSGGISISNQSDSNATSTRSFAFPTLEAEYSSPVRMGKAERRRLRKEKGWGQVLLCCKF
ncbi:hypothetical protein L2E82_44681 [Cichorium intybus]|uniref:Uncharacterized protein n=1 Tax=Cichorium intybus TaxID=13427 RepID=A0ACB8ZRF3_CICIN|nr:hypothetical protein L2E82_44681 [Cichorium intybus]